MEKSTLQPIPKPPSPPVHNRLELSTSLTLAGSTQPVTLPMPPNSTSSEKDPTSLPDRKRTFESLELPQNLIDFILTAKDTTPEELTVMITQALNTQSNASAADAEAVTSPNTSLGSALNELIDRAELAEGDEVNKRILLEQIVNAVRGDESLTGSAEAVNETTQKIAQAAAA